MSKRFIDTGDTVFHRPTKETWVVAGVEHGRLYWCGWPPGSADPEDCLLVDKASLSKRMELLHDLAGGMNGHLSGYARRRLEGKVNP